MSMTPIRSRTYGCRGCLLKLGLELRHFGFQSGPRRRLPRLVCACLGVRLNLDGQLVQRIALGLQRLLRL
jgi:hypothetical protein